MSDPLCSDSLPDDLFRNRIEAALRELDQPESEADIAAALDSVEPAALSDAATQRILRQVWSSIASTRPAPRVSGASIAVDLQQGSRDDRRPVSGSSQLSIVVACVAMLVGVGLMFHLFGGSTPAPLANRNGRSQSKELLAAPALSPEVRATVTVDRAKSGDTISTDAREKRRVTLPDGSVLSINERTKVAIIGERRLKLLAGEVFVEVVPATSAADRFVVETPHRQVTALGTKFVVKAQGNATNVVVTQGKVQVSGVDEVIPAGQELIADLTESKSVELRPAKRSAFVVEWIKDLMAAAGTIVVPASEHAGGTITVVDPQGQEMKLSLRKFHVDVHIEDGFARTTIDQTYFNHTWQQLEGTFRFPLPADASLSRLAMYVNGTLMEGGMVERDYGRNVFEQIRHTRRDPALLEWVDGSTFQMRVFPLEARQEKRILLSYTQRLPTDYGKSIYRFPTGHSLEGVGVWSTNVRVKGAAGTKWYSPSHLLTSRDDQGDLVIEGREEYATLDRDLVVELGDPTQTIVAKSDPNWSVFEQDRFRYVMLRQRPELKGAAERPQRQWIFLVENSADRNTVLAETQRQIVKVLLDNTEHSDTFSIVRAGTQAELFRRKPVPCSIENIAAAQQFLNEVAPIGALDLGEALQTVQQQASNRDLWIVHLGTGIPVLGERDETTLTRLLPAKARYVGVAVGKRWSKSFMESAASHSGGHITQINPDEAVAWRAFDLLSTLNAPRLTEIHIATNRDEADAKRPNKPAADAQFLLLTNSLAHGQELAAVARFAKDQWLPASVTITGKLNGAPFSQVVTVPPTFAVQAGHLPRTWARSEIDRLVALGTTENKAQIIELSKAMYVMSPFTSLLVLETEAMYEQFKVDRGRKDHWAMYPAPAQIPVVGDAALAHRSPLEAAKERLKLAQSRQKAAQSNYERSLADKRPAADLKRLERLNRAEQEEVRLIDSAIKRMEQADEAAANPKRKAWESVILRRSMWWQQHVYPYHHYWGLNQWSDMEPEGLRVDQFGDDMGLGIDVSGTILKGLHRDRLGLNTNGIDGYLVDSFSSLDDVTLLGEPALRFPPADQWHRLAKLRSYGLPSLARTNSMRLNELAGVQLAQQIKGVARIPQQHLFGSQPLGWAFQELPSAYYLADDIQYFPVESREGLLVGNRQMLGWIPDNGLGVATNFTTLLVDSSSSMDFAKTPMNNLAFIPDLAWGKRYRGGRGFNFGNGAFIPAGAADFDYITVNGTVRLVDLQGRPVWIQTHNPLAHIIKDLPSYAPGLQTWLADRLAIVEQVGETKPVHGEVDAEARRLIEKARSLGWEKVRIAVETKRPRPQSDSVVVDGAGRFVLNREISEGLQETVVNDGTTLWHLYPEIGLGAKRTLSRFHQSAIQSLVPWYVPSINDLSVEADVKSVGQRTVRITNRKRDDKDSAKAQAETQKDSSQLAIELVFAEEGRLSELRVIDVAANKLVSKQTIAVDGTVRVFSGEDKVVGEIKYERQPTEAPNLIPQTIGLVVLPLPYRSSDSVGVTVPTNLQTNSADFAKLSDEDALKLLATYFAEGRASELASFVDQRFTIRGDHRIGLAVLLSGVFPQSPLVANATAQHPDSPLARFLQAFAQSPAQGNLNGTMDAGTSASPFLRRVCSAYNVYSMWVVDRGVTRDRAAADVEKDLEASLLAIRDCRSLDLAARLLATIQAAFKRTERMNAAFAKQLNASVAAIAEERSIRAFGRLERIEWLLTIGDEASVVQAKDLLRTHLKDSIDIGVLPELSSDVRAAFVKHFKTVDGQPCQPWGTLVDEATHRLLEQEQYFGLIELARRCVALNERTLAATIFKLATQDQDSICQRDFNLAALAYAKEAGDWEQAETCVHRALADEKDQKNTSLWRDAADIAHHRQKFDDWIQYLEKAYELEFSSLPKTVDLEQFRQDYEKLFGQLEQRTEQLTDAKRTEKIAFAQVVQRAATRWREIDTDDTVVCHRTARMMTKLGLVTAAWSYWTTPLAETPDRAIVWQSFASAMVTEQQFSTADRAWSTAFECEPTNPEILLQHAQYLRSMNQEQRAREMLTKITTSNWQPRFDQIKAQAQTLLTAGLK